jgi:hypothetical protein
MPWPLLILAGAAKAVAHTASTTVATKVAAGIAKTMVTKGTAAKGAAAHKGSSAALPREVSKFAKDATKDFVKQLADGRDDDRDKNKS